MNKTIPTKIAMILISILVIIVGIFIYWEYSETQKEINVPLIQVKIPKAIDETANWKTYTNTDYGVKFKYPETFAANVWRAQFWPPIATVIPIAKDPLKSGCPEVPPNAQETQVTINGINYTLYVGQDPGAGSLYSSYCYIAQKNQKYYILYFVIWSHLGCGGGNCGAYCGTQFEIECKNLDRTTMIEKPIEKIVSTFKF
jgi:hypothetical protein